MSEMIELGLLHEEHFRKNPISGTVVQHLVTIDAEMDQRLASEHGAERLRNTLSSPDFQTNICGEEIFLKLLAAFREDHAVLGRGFNELSCCLRAADILGAARAAQGIYEEAGPHICFEEEDFYPALVPLLGEKTVRKMRQEHCCGFDAVRTLLNRRPDLPLPADLSKRLLAQSEVMEAHIAECGELFAALHHITSADQQVLYDKLMKWRREQPKLDLDRRTVGCGALRLVQCHPAALPLDASRRSSLPIAEQPTVRIGPAERREVARLASRLIADEPALVANDTLDPRTGSGIADGPALFFEDHSEIALPSGAPLAYRSRLLAGDGDVVVIGGRRHPEFEAYCRDLLGLGDPTIVVPAKPVHTSLARRCADDPELMAQLCDLARRAGRFGLVPYLGSESAWGLASAIATQSGEPVWVAAPGPRLSRRVNDKLWFSERVTEVLGRRALPQTHRVYGPEALARRIALLVRSHKSVCIKVPDGAGGAGNLIIEARWVIGMPLQSLWQYLLRSLRELGWRGRYPLLVGVWESPLVASPSVQLWIPHRTIGAPVVEGVFEQIVEEGQFVGASPSTLPAVLRQRIAEEAVYIACLFQELGYFGRCSLDAVLLDSGALHWIECNGRWGGVSIPMTLINRLVGDWQSRSFVIVHRFGLRLRPRGFGEVMAQLRERLFRSGGPAKGIVLFTPDAIEEGSGFHFLVLGDSRSEVLAEAKEIAAFLS